MNYSASLRELRYLVNTEKAEKIFLKHHRKWNKHISFFKANWILDKTVAKIFSALNIKSKYLNAAIEKYQSRIDNGVLGTFERTSEFGGNITIYYRKNFTYARFFAVLVHECMHYYLCINHYDYSNEELTDLACYELGFDNIMTAGYAGYSAKVSVYRHKLQVRPGYVHKDGPFS